MDALIAIKEEIIGEIMNLNRAYLTNNMEEAAKYLSRNFVFNFYEGNKMETHRRETFDSKSLPSMFNEFDIKRFDQIDYSIRVENRKIFIENKFLIEYLKENRKYSRTGTETFELHKEPCGWKFDSRTMKFDDE